MLTGTIMPASPTSTGSASRLRTRSSPTSNSRRASSPTTRKNSAISPEFTNPCRSVVMPWPPTTTDRRVVHTWWYVDRLTFAQIRAAIVAAARTEALPVSVRRKERSGVSLPHKVRPANTDPGEASSVDGAASAGDPASVNSATPSR